MKMTHLAGIALTLLIASCGSDKESTGTAPIQDTLPTGTGVPLTPAPGTPAPAAAPRSEGGNLNPAHGQPGHRCDIAVGAPLDSKPGPTPSATTPVTTSTAPATQDMVISATGGSATMTTPSNPAGSGAVKLNPAHGQPGHRCDIAVGEPLDSKPVTSGTTPAPSEKKEPVNPIVPAPVSAPAPTPSITTTAPGMNPAHGQPGHRCDIAVGAPLNSAPQKNKN